MTKPRIWIRIGTQKTGSSALQAWCADNSASLKDHGLLYSRSGQTRPASGALARAMLADDPQAQMLISQLMQDIESAGPAISDVLISSENFSTAPAATFAPLFDALRDHDITVMVSLRRQDMFAESLIKQWIKWNGQAAENYQGYLRQTLAPLLDYDRLLNDWASTYPQARLVPQIYPEAGSPEGPPDTIAATLGAMGYGQLVPQGSAARRTNVSPSGALVRHYRSIGDVKRLRSANRAFMKRHAVEFSGRADFLTAAERDAILADCAAANERLRQRWFPKRDRLFDEFHPVAPQADNGAVAAFRRFFEEGKTD